MRMTYVRNGETLALDRALCNGCGRCIAVCPHAVLAMVDQKAQIVDSEACMECGACSNNCETGAITVKAGVGCAAAVISGMIRGTAPQCGCGGGSSPADRHVGAGTQKTGCCG